ncbi:hypothetical protein B0J11DRAFT_449546, partial [Dendryphion nanum]
AAVFALSSPAEAQEWVCGRTGGSHAALKQAHADFNKLFGARRLTAAGNQCYYSMCKSYVFGFCNTSSRTRTEKSNHRNNAKDESPGRGSSCAISFNAPADGHLLYRFSHTKDIKICEGKCGLYKNDVRRC